MNTLEESWFIYHKINLSIQYLSSLSIRKETACQVAVQVDRIQIVAYELASEGGQLVLGVQLAGESGSGGEG